MSPTVLRCFDEPLTGRLRALGGTHRAASLAATWRRFAPLAPRVGITRLADLTGLDTLGVPVFAAIRPMGRSLSTSQGKGTTALAARVSALMESLETWHAEERAPDRTATARALGPSTIALARALPRGPRRLDVDARLPWVRGWSLPRARPVWVPWQSVTLDCVPVAREAPVFDVSSNGLASGNTLGEAIVHGLCEVIERDAEAAWRAGGADRRVVLDTVAPPVARLVERLRAGGVRVWLWDLTSDVGVPVFGCGLMHDPREAGWRAVGFYQGFGCHVDPAIAMLRAITEAVQTRLTYIAGGRDDFFPDDYARATDRALLDEIWARYAAPPDESIDAREHPRPPAGEREVGAVLDHLLVRLADSGSAETIVVDLRQPGLGVPVVKVLVPGRANRVAGLG
ncbi:MAG TPA: YcaO-like family protein [Kofleriaceae bacterium]|nr:YcaO-like family protein [Kofleriaceae bacterium]